MNLTLSLLVAVAAPDSLTRWTRTQRIPAVEQRRWQHSDETGEYFKQSLLRGNVVDLAIAVVMGVAFRAVVTALVASLARSLQSTGDTSADERRAEASGTGAPTAVEAEARGPGAVQWVPGRLIVKCGTAA